MYVLHRRLHLCCMKVAWDWLGINAITFIIYRITGAQHLLTSKYERSQAISVFGNASLCTYVIRYSIHHSVDSHANGRTHKIILLAQACNAFLIPTGVVLLSTHIPDIALEMLLRLPLVDTRRSLCKSKNYLIIGLLVCFDGTVISLFINTSIRGILLIKLWLNTAL